MDSYHYPFVFKMKEEDFQGLFEGVRELVAVQGFGRPVVQKNCNMKEPSSL